MTAVADVVIASSPPGAEQAAKETMATATAASLTAANLLMMRSLTSMQEGLLTLHILAAAVWIGGGIYALLSYRRHAALGTLRSAMTADQKVGSVFGISIGLLLLSGIALVLNSERFSFTHAFVLIGIGAIVLSGAIEGTVFAKATKEAMASGGERVELPRQFRWALPYYAVLFAVTVWAMVAKLGA